mmetsp:Transcript_14006/g.19897  ORF Transcript_14006/g.19897 Transcript_14006/m.19897 type:complete len:342 (+) Transcript_14006:194-1219(+)|eukprot:CAMPEP_0201697412 /NCGR_PEP_ID=MMETSP0578-20130828/11297_1 /ASSEMBLY_ACC=CAM_ASM_000663 /TAXON_ID=267565 /ORGANISM="Skeletonema grethea, Strain CCMP 1804" /LENGTH=341 /DNA_ID=CAMNT_0048183587 /DNA_START=168 /DNA_END=1193 /DNA_ORIENTATION=+
MNLILRLILLADLLCLSTAGLAIFGLPSPRLHSLKNSSSSDDFTETTTEAQGDEANAFENIVRRVSKNKQYKFGDLSKKVVSSSTKGVEGVVKQVTKNEDYHFGDITRTAVGATTHGAENLIRGVIKNEDYKFGDLTRGAVSTVRSTTEGVLTYSEKTLSLLRGANIHELVELLSLFWNKNMNNEERVEAFAVLVYLGAIMVLSYSFIANLMQGIVFAAAWYKVAAATGQAPLASPQVWSSFMQTKSALDFVFGGPFLPVRVAATIPWFFKYRYVVVRTAYRSPLREKFPILNRIVSLLSSWVFANLAFVGGVTYLLVKLASIKAGVVPPALQDFLSFPIG